MRPVVCAGVLLAATIVSGTARAGNIEDDIDWDFDSVKNGRTVKPKATPQPLPTPKAKPTKPAEAARQEDPAPIAKPSPQPASEPPKPSPVVVKPSPQPSPEPAKPASTSGDTEPAAFAGTLAAHNRVRANVGVGPLVWSEAVASVAQAWANHLKDTRNCNMQHSSNRYGENLFWGSGKRYSMSEAVASWASEGADYTYASNNCRSGAVCGHYTQVVWRNSKAVGCGMATCGSSMVVVCNYDPPGNYVGQKPY
jgi:uncharacterized protein YkwD